MSRYMNRHGGCFYGEGLVSMADGSFKKVRDIVKGDTVLCDHTTTNKVPFATVKCVVKTINEKSEFKMVKIQGGLQITPYHPIKLNGEWAFPSYYADARELKCQAVYDFVLDEGHTVKIDGVTVVTLGHRLRESPIVEHEYFGTSKVIEDLSNLNGWNEGRVILENGGFARHTSTGRICGLSL